MGIRSQVKNREDWFEPVLNIHNTHTHTPFPHSHPILFAPLKFSSQKIFFGRKNNGGHLSSLTPPPNYPYVFEPIIVNSKHKDDENNNNNKPLHSSPLPSITHIKVLRGPKKSVRNNNRPSRCAWRRRLPKYAVITPPPWNHTLSKYIKMLFAMA